MRARMLRRATAFGELGSRAVLTRARSSAAANAEAPRFASEPWRTRPGLNRFHDRRDVDFVLFEVEGVASGADGAVDAEAHAGAVAVLDAAERFVADWGHVDPVLDQEPPTLTPAADTADGKAAVRVHPQTTALLRELCDRGFFQMSELGLPFPVQCAASFLLGCGFSSNPIGFAVLTRCAADLLEAHGTAELKKEYLGPMRAGQVFGTMALSEPQAGSSLAAIRTRARRSEIQEGGEAPLGPEWRIKGDKMWTSGAFHDVTTNTVHMLLARIDAPDTPPGARGVSLFLVPNVLPDGRKNDVEVVSLNKKMGHRALPNCAWTLGDSTGGAVGYQVGEPHQGLQAMFLMMNAMRIEVGLSAAAVGKRGLNESLLYAEQREQGGKRIVEYPDVKRMLLLQKAYTEGGFALAMHAATLHQRKSDGDAEAGASLDAIVEIVKSWPSEFCLEANKWAIQVLGGAGYIRDYPVEQLYRDNRLNMIHEGTAGIHALTLLGRKAPRGAAAPLLASVLEAAAAAEAEAGRLVAGGAAAEGAAVLREGAQALRRAAGRAEQVTAFLTRPIRASGASGDGPGAAVALSHAHDYLGLMGHTLVAATWVRLATAAAPRHAAAAGVDGFYAGKLQTALFFLRHELPKTEAMAALMLSADATVHGMRSDWF